MAMRKPFFDNLLISAAGPYRHLARSRLATTYFGSKRELSARLASSD